MFGNFPAQIFTLSILQIVNLLTNLQTGQMIEQQFIGVEKSLWNIMAEGGFKSTAPPLEEKEKIVRKTALDMRALLCVNSSKGVFPTTDGSDPEYPDVDCNQVFQNLYLGNK